MVAIGQGFSNAQEERNFASGLPFKPHARVLRAYNRRRPVIENNAAASTRSDLGDRL